MLECDICKKEFKNYRALNGHKRLHGPSKGELILKRKTHDNHCDYCGKHINRKRTDTENKFCSLSCFHDYQWEHITRVRVLEGNGDVRTIKKYLIEEYDEKCVECGCGNTWNKKPITLQVDHIDGDSDNNDIKNVRLLCPNCHTQTETYGSKGTGSRYKKETKRNNYLRKYKGY